MTEDLLTYLSQLVPQLKVDNIRTSIELLELVRGDEVTDGVQQLYNNLTDLEETNAVLDIETSIFNWLIETIKRYNITFLEEEVTVTDIPLLNDILYTLIHVEYVDDVENVYNVMELACPINESFANVVEVVTNRPAHEVMEKVNYVSPNLMLNMKSIIQKNYRELQNKLEEDIKLDKVQNVELMRQKRESLFKYIDKLSKGDKTLEDWFKGFVQRIINTPTDELFNKIWNIISSRKLTVTQQVGLWCISIRLAEFIDSSQVDSEIKYDRVKQAKMVIEKVYEDQNLLFTINLRINEELSNG